MMTIAPPFLLTAALLFWGWFADILVPAATMACVLEAPRFHGVRWDFTERDFQRVADLCTVTFAAVLLYKFLQSRHFPDSLLLLLTWLPMMFFLLMAAQRYSTHGRVPLSALFWSMRRSPEHAVTALPLDHAYGAVCLLAASAANPRTPWFYAGICLLAGYALYPAAPRGRSRALWAVALGAALAIGLGLHVGLQKLQARIEDWALEYLSARWAAEADPYRSRTAIGDIGVLKTSDRIVMRVDAQGRSPPARLRNAAYDFYAGSSWTAPGRQFSPVPADGDGWPLAQGHGGSIRISTWLTSSRALLALPLDTYRLTSLNVARTERNPLGAVRITEGPDMVVFDAWADPAARVDGAPGAGDLQVPPALAPALDQVTGEIGLHGRAPAEAVQAIAQFFAQNFAYTLTLAGPDGRPRALSQFLLQDRRGHCEYFATSTVLLLRSAGIPARYATGYAVQEYSPLERQFVVRARHAHAWALAWVDGRWQELDTTPSVWASEDENHASPWQPIYDVASLLNYLLARWRAAPESARSAGAGLLWLTLPLALFLGWRLYRHRRVHRRNAIRRVDQAARDPRIAPVLAALMRRGHVRPDSAPLLSWICGLPVTDASTRRMLEAHVRDYYRLRFDPTGADPDLNSRLARQAAELHQRLRAAPD